MYTVKTGLNIIRARLHLIPEQPSENDLKIVHEYRLDRHLTKAEKWLSGPSTYAVDCDGEPEDVSIKLKVSRTKR